MSKPQLNVPCFCPLYRRREATSQGPLPPVHRRIPLGRVHLQGGDRLPGVQSGRLPPSHLDMVSYCSCWIGFFLYWCGMILFIYYLWYIYTLYISNYYVFIDTSPIVAGLVLVMLFFCIDASFYYSSNNLFNAYKLF